MSDYWSHWQMSYSLYFGRTSALVGNDANERLILCFSIFTLIRRPLSLVTRAMHDTAAKFISKWSRMIQLAKSRAWLTSFILRQGNYFDMIIETCVLLRYDAFCFNANLKHVSATVLRPHPLAMCDNVPRQFSFELDIVRHVYNKILASLYSSVEADDYLLSSAYHHSSMRMKLGIDIASLMRPLYNWHRLPSAWPTMVRHLAALIQRWNRHFTSSTQMPHYQ